MIRATFIAVALAASALSSGAQNPTPEPAPVPAPPSPEVKPVQPTPAPKAKRAPLLPKVWRSDLLDLEDRLDALKDMDFDLVTPIPPIPPIPPIEMPDMDFDFDLAPAALAMDRVWESMPDSDFDFAMPTVPPVPDLPPLPELAPMPSSKRREKWVSNGWSKWCWSSKRPTAPGPCRAAAGRPWWTPRKL